MEADCKNIFLKCKNDKKKTLLCNKFYTCFIIIIYSQFSTVGEVNKWPGLASDTLP